MTDEPIRIRGARQHNLKNMDLDLPRRRLTVVTGPSGSGKSSLALDTLFAEGQRRYVESLSTYAKQFLDRMEKPDVDRIDGISPAVAIEQKNPTKTSRSTVGTATEVHDYLRLLWSRVGRTHCPECGRRRRPDTVSSAVDRTLELPDGHPHPGGLPPPDEPEEVTPPARGGEPARHGLRAVLADGDLLDLGLADAEDPVALGPDLTPRRRGAGHRGPAEGGPRRSATVWPTRWARASRRARASAWCSWRIPGRGRVGPSGPARFTERFRCPEHPERALPRAHAAALQLQQPVRHVPAVHRLRRHAGVRPRPHRPQPPALHRRGRGGSVGEAPLQQGAGPPAGVRPGREGVPLHALGRAGREASGGKSSTDREAEGRRRGSHRDRLQGRGPVPGERGRRSATSSTSGSSCASTRARCPAACAAAPGCAPRR